MRDNNSKTTPDTKGSTFKQWFFIPYTLIINILSCFDIIDSTHNIIQIVPEIIIEVIFILLRNFKLQSFIFAIMINFFSCLASHLAFIASNVMSSE